ncbi:MAG: glycoside hydrolase family 2 [Gammaproteobacteria bacterium]|nr:glycoside hydrolase family 2 [Gammaproteobacteria bacterium]
MYKIKSFDINHPNPIFYRPTYTILNGVWDFYLDYKNIGEKNKFNEGFTEEYKINVPFAYNTIASGINITKKCNNVWYKRTIDISDLNSRYLLHLEGADYITKIWINSKNVCINRGAYHRITKDITDELKIGENLIVIKCEDSLSTIQPRGKQRFTKKNFMCWYEETTGIFKDVWLEKVPKEYIKSIKITPDVDTKSVNFIIKTEGISDSLNVEVSFKDKVVLNEDVRIDNNTFSIKLDEIELWNVLDPKLYDLKLTYNEDIVYSYFAFRKLEIKNSKVYLNGNELYQKLVLDQGYFDKGLLTPSNPKELIDDIDNMIDMGFNGARKHQKREDDRFYAYADMCGYILWAEMPSAYKSCKKMFENLKYEWLLIVKELYNHPSIICWTPINESWGVYLIHKKKIEQNFVNELYDSTKKYDNTRFCLTNDGWEHTKSDFLTIHLYNQDPLDFKEKIDLALTKGRIKSIIPVPYKTYAKGYKYNGEPIIISEFGGTSNVLNQNDGWGYGSTVKSDKEYEDRLRSLFKVIKDNDLISGYCYTQVSDVRQEVNGLYTMDRRPKISKDIMKEIQK